MAPITELTAMLALLAVSAGTGAGAPVPTDLVRALADARQAIEAANSCIPEHTGTQSDRFAAQAQRFSELQTKVRSLWGRQSIVEPDIDQRVVCQSTATMIDSAKARLDTLEQSFAAHSAPYNSGVWIGTLPLCGAGPVTVRKAVDEYRGDDILQITLDETGAADLAALTTANVGNQLAVRVDGNLIMAPYVNEPVTGGSIQVTGSSKADIDRLAALLARCAG